MYDDVMTHAEQLVRPSSVLCWYDRCCSRIFYKYKQRYLELNGSVAARPTKQLKSMASFGKISQLLRELSDDEDEEDNLVTSAYGDPQQPWLDDFHGYLNSKDHLASGMSIVQWWGVNATRYPVWSSLARDYLAIMATSVSSERAFSSSAITITKRRNRLNGDIVEALQCLKCLIRRDLLFREADDPSVVSEVVHEDDCDSGVGELVSELNEDVVLVVKGPIEGLAGGGTDTLEDEFDNELFDLYTFE